MPFTGMSFMNECLLQPTLHFDHPLLQFADISDVKTEFFSQPIIDSLKTVFLLIIEMSLLFETTDECLTGQAYSKSHVGIT